MSDRPKLDLVVLAAGVGSRLHPITDETPKCLVRVAGKPILWWLLDQVRELRGWQDLRTYVVVGYRANDVSAFVEALDFPVNLIVNADYETTNNMYSLSLSFRHLDHDRGLVVVNGDCIYARGILRSFLALRSSAIAVDSSAYYKESMKVKVVNGKVRSISKEIKPAANVFTAIDLYKFSDSVRNTLIDVTMSFINGRDLTQWTEVAINRMLQDENIHVAAHDIAGKPWIEVDTPEDLKSAEVLFGPDYRVQGHT
jgi:choline kinase